MQTYKKLFTYWFSILIYDLTVEFCRRWIKSWKLKQQMTGAARSGKQNIVEGSDNMETSLKLAINLTGVAKSSLEELTGDLEDFVRQNDLRLWDKSDQPTRVIRTKSSEVVRSLSNLRSLRAEEERKLLKQFALPKSPEEAANLLLTLCHQATYLLHKQVEALKQKHMTEGGLTEELYRKRVEYRKNPRKSAINQRKSKNGKI